MMKVRLLFFAVLRDVTGKRPDEVKEEYEKKKALMKRDELATAAETLSSCRVVVSTEEIS